MPIQNLSPLGLLLIVPLTLQMTFMEDLASRLKNRVQLTTDGHKAYLTAVENAFGGNIDYARLVKIYGNINDSQDKSARKYSPPECTEVKKI